MADTLYTTISSPIDDLLLTGDGERLTRLYMRPVDGSDWRIGPGWRRDAAPFADVESQLDAYFAGEREDFDLPLALHGTDFQMRVWEQLTRIPYGETISYSQLALRLGDPKLVRAVGLANGRNPVSIIVPCHRVIGADGSLVGYGGGLERKQWLLEHEAVTSGRRLPVG